MALKEYLQALSLLEQIAASGDPAILTSLGTQSRKNTILFTNSDYRRKGSFATRQRASGAGSL